VAKKPARQEDADSDYLFANFLQLPAFVQRPAREIRRRSPPCCQFQPSLGKNLTPYEQQIAALFWLEALLMSK
jgi:hypothetical protein